MKRLKYAGIIILILCLQGCIKTLENRSNHKRNIVLSAIRKPDFIGNKEDMLVAFETKDGDEWDNLYPEVSGIPDSLTNIKIYYRPIDRPQALYQTYKAGKFDKKTFEYYISEWDSDTTFCTAQYIKLYIVLVTGQSLKGKTYYICDTNNDYSIADEKPVDITKDYMHPNLIKIRYEKFNEEEIQQDSTWISIMEMHNNTLLQYTEYTYSTLTIDTVHYIIKTYPSFGVSNLYERDVKFCIYKSSELNPTDLHYNQSIKLNDSITYNISCSRDGLKLYLNEYNSDNAANNLNIEAAIHFNAVTIDGDSIDLFNDFKGKYILLDFWSTACKPCVEEIKERYIDLYKNYGGDKFEIIGISSDPEEVIKSFALKNNINWTMLSSSSAKQLIKKYQIKAFPTPYLIDPDGFILAKGNDLRNKNIESTISDLINSN